MKETKSHSSQGLGRKEGIIFSMPKSYEMSIGAVEISNLAGTA
jgi:hypothetical protein